MEKELEYTPDMSMVIAHTMIDIRNRAHNGQPCFGQQLIYPKGVKKFGERGRAGAVKELDQLHNRNTFNPLDVSEISPSELRKSQEGMMLLTEKTSGDVKGRYVYNGKPTREWHNKEDSASPTASTESVFLTSIIEAKERRDNMTTDVPNAFVQTPMPKPKPGEDRVIMKITGELVDMLVKLAPDVYAKFVTYDKKGRKILYVEVTMVIYGMLIAALLWYQKFKKDLENYGFEFNPYDPCVANKIVNGKQQTILFHVDDVKT